MGYTIRPLETSTWPAFAELVERKRRCDGRLLVPESASRPRPRVTGGEARSEGGGIQSGTSGNVARRWWMRESAYACRNVRMGSTFAARAAGIHAASRHTATIRPRLAR